MGARLPLLLSLLAASCALSPPPPTPAPPPPPPAPSAEVPSPPGPKDFFWNVAGGSQRLYWRVRGAEGERCEEWAYAPRRVPAEYEATISHEEDTPRGRVTYLYELDEGVLSAPRVRYVGEPEAAERRLSCPDEAPSEKVWFDDAAACTASITSRAEGDLAPRGCAGLLVAPEVRAKLATEPPSSGTPSAAAFLASLGKKRLIVLLEEDRPGSPVCKAYPLTPAGKGRLQYDGYYRSEISLAGDDITIEELPIPGSLQRQMPDGQAFGCCSSARGRPLVVTAEGARFAGTTWFSSRAACETARARGERPGSILEAIAPPPPPESAAPAPPERFRRPPQLRMGAVKIPDGLDREAVLRTVRQQFGAFRRCYEAALRADPRLGGRVTTRFSIEADGRVTGAAVADSDLPDKAMTSCIVAAFAGLRFPPPEGGKATAVEYPLMFHPGDP